MSPSLARIRTPKARRYLEQLCRHADAVRSRDGQHPHGPGRTHAHPRIVRVIRSDTDATLDFDRGRCVVEAGPDVLVLRIEADDAVSLQQLESLIAADIERFANREQLTVVWRNDGDTGQQAAPPPAY